MSDVFRTSEMKNWSESSKAVFLKDNFCGFGDGGFGFWFGLGFFVCSTI